MHGLPVRSSREREQCSAAWGGPNSEPHANQRRNVKKKALRKSFLANAAIDNSPPGLHIYHFTPVDYANLTTFSLRT
jgi:hypothetical protein